MIESISSRRRIAALAGALSGLAACRTADRYYRNIEFVSFGRVNLSGEFSQEPLWDKAVESYYRWNSHRAEILHYGQLGAVYDGRRRVSTVNVDAWGRPEGFYKAYLLGDFGNFRFWLEYHAIADRLTARESALRIAFGEKRFPYGDWVTSSQSALPAGAVPCGEILLRLLALDQDEFLAVAYYDVNGLSRLHSAFPVMNAAKSLIERLYALGISLYGNFASSIRAEFAASTGLPPLIGQRQTDGSPVLSGAGVPLRLLEDRRIELFDQSTIFRETCQATGVTIRQYQFDPFEANVLRQMPPGILFRMSPSRGL